MNIKEKIIHMLGGFTKEETVFMNSAAIMQPIARESRDIRRFKVGYFIQDPRHQPPEEFIKNELMAKLANRILEENLVEFYTAPRDTGSNEYPQEVYAVIDVVDRGARWDVMG